MTSNWLDLVQTKTIEMILAPIASQVSLAIIMSETWQESKPINPAPDIERDAKSVIRAMEHLADMASQVAQQSHDQDLIRKMPHACENLNMAGKHLLAVTHKLQLESWHQEAWDSLVTVTKDILINTAKVLLLCDNAEIKKILDSADNVSNFLHLLDTSQDMTELVNNMKNFVDSMHQFSLFTNKRQQELAHPGYREKLFLGMKNLHNTIPMLNTALKTFIKYPQNIQARASKQQLIDKIQGIIHDITKVIEWRPSQDPDNTFSEEFEKPGYFVIQIEQAIGFLLDKWRPILDKEFDCIIENIICHSMSVAHIADEYYREIIIKNCRQILELKSILTERSFGIQSNPTFVQLRADFDDSCEELINSLSTLERNVKLCLIRLIVEVFKEIDAPLERLLKAAFRTDQVHQHSISTQDNLGPYILSFTQHSDSIIQVAHFMAANSIDIKRVESLKSSIRQLELLDLDILPAVLSCLQLNRANLHNLNLLRKQWVLETTNLLSMIDELTDTRAFIRISAICMKEAFRQCKEAFHNHDEVTAAESSRTILCQAKRVSHVALHYVNNSDDPIFRNGLLVFINELDKAMLIVKVAISKLLEQMTNPVLYKKLSKKVHHLLDCVEKVRIGLDGINHVDILDPLRQNVRLSRLKKSDIDSGSDTNDEEVKHSSERINKFLRTEPVSLRSESSTLKTLKNESTLLTNFRTCPEISESVVTDRIRCKTPDTGIKSFIPKATPLLTSTPASVDNLSNKNSRSIATAAWFLQQETSKWDEKKNTIVQAAKEMSSHMTHMAEFSKGIGPITNKKDMIKTAQAITKNGEIIVKFAMSIAKLCVDERFKKDLFFHAEHIATFSTQLSIISNVKLATSDDRATDTMLVKNAENLMKAVTQTLKVAQVACVRGLNPNTKPGDEDVTGLVVEWKRKLQDRYLSRSNCSLNELGLRIVPHSEYLCD